MSKISKVFHDPTTIEREFIESGLECCTRIVPQGYRCGYVAIPKGHPLFGMDWENEETEALDVDGGITYGEGDEDIWVLGWDAGHGWHLPDPSLQTELGDYLRMMGEIFFAPIIDMETVADREKYMVDADMAEAETRKLARQLAEMRNLPSSKETSGDEALEDDMRTFAKTVGDLYSALLDEGINRNDIPAIIAALFANFGD